MAINMVHKRFCIHHISNDPAYCYPTVVLLSTIQRELYLCSADCYIIIVVNTLLGSVFCINDTTLAYTAQFFVDQNIDLRLPVMQPMAVLLLWRRSCQWHWHDKLKRG